MPKKKTTEDLLQELRDSQGPGDALLEINIDNVKLTTGKKSKRVPKELMDGLRKFVKWQKEMEEKYGRDTCEAASTKLINEIIESIAKT